MIKSFCCAPRNDVLFNFVLTQNRQKEIKTENFNVSFRFLFLCIFV
jgi:hypothetical protein